MKEHGCQVQSAGRIKPCSPTVSCSRRELFKLGAVAAGVALTPGLLASPSRAAVTATLVHQGKPLEVRGTSFGKILTSSDEGNTWQVAADFGRDCPVLSLQRSSGGLRADVGHRGYRFSLISQDGWNWSA